MAFKGRKLAFLLIYSLRQSDEAHIKSKNYLSYIAAELRNHRDGQVFWGQSEDELIRKAHAEGFDYALLVREGTVFSGWSTFLEHIEAEWTPDHFCTGHILDRKDRYYEIHNQAFFVDLHKMAQLGFPSYDRDLNSTSLIQNLHILQNVERSEENFHDDYTPHWIKKGEGLQSFSKISRGSRWISLALTKGYKISAFNHAARGNKHFFYPEHQESYLQNKVYIKDLIDLDAASFYIFNTESLEKRDGIKPLDKLIVPASGLMPFYILKNYGYTGEHDTGRKTRVIIYDINHIQTEIYRKLIHEWDGRNYKRYAKWLCGPNLIKGERWEPLDRKIFDELFESDDHFCEWLNQLKQNCEFDFIRANGLASNFKKQPWLVSDQSQSSYISLSNIFHYWPTAVEFSYRFRMERLNDLMFHLSQHSPETWVNYCSVDKDENGALRPDTKLIQAKNFLPVKIHALPWEEGYRENSSYTGNNQTL